MATRVPRRPAEPAPAPHFPAPGIEGVPAPAYVKLAIWLLVNFGAPMVMLILFFFVFVGYFPSPVTETRQDVIMIKQAMTKLTEAVQGQTKVWNQICRNTSRDPADRMSCEK